MVATFAVPYESSIDVKPRLVGICRRCNLVVDPYPGPGYECEYCWDNYYSWEWRPRLVKRLMWRCPLNDSGECHLYFFSRKHLLEHEHGEFEPGP